MSKASKELKRAREQAQRPNLPSVHLKLPIWLRGTAELQNAEKPNRIVSRPSYKFPMTVKL